MNEHSYVRSIHKKLPDTVYTWKIHDSYAGGVPDAWYHGPSGKSIFIEYKYVKTLPQRAATIVRPALSMLQLNWITSRVKAGVQCAVILGTTEGSIIFIDSKELKDGIEASTARTRLKNPRQVVQYILESIT